MEIYDNILPCDWVFSTHRNHYHALLKGIPAERLRELIRNGRSMFVYSKDHNFACSAVLAGTCAIAAGVAWALKEEGSSAKVICFIGDGGEEEGHFYEALMWVEHHDLPCTFIVEDNDRSVDTPREHRTCRFNTRDRDFKHLKWYHYTPTYPHAGSGCSFQITFKPAAIDRLKRSVRPTSEFSDNRCDFIPDEFGRATNRPYSGDCLPGHKEYRKYWEPNDPELEKKLMRKIWKR